MQNCLAATGADTTGIALIAVALVALGAIFAVLAIRRGRGRAALLLLALPFLAGGAALAQAPAPAQAQAGVPCPTPTATPVPTPTPTPTPVCTPEEAVPDVAIEGLGWSLSDSATSYQALFADEDIAQFTITAATVLAIDDNAEFSAAAFVESEEPPVGPVALEEGDFIIDGAVVNVETGVFQDILGTAELGTFSIVVTFSYDDGCGDTLTTELTLAAPFDFVPVP